MEAEAKTDAKSETQSEELDSEPAGTGGLSWAEGEDEAQFTYDEAGNAYAYDAEGNCYVYDAEGNVWAYDELGNPYLYQSAPGYFEAEGYEPVGDDTDGTNAGTANTWVSRATAVLARVHSIAPSTMPARLPASLNRWPYTLKTVARLAARSLTLARYRHESQNA